MHLTFIYRKHWLLSLTKSVMFCLKNSNINAFHLLLCMPLKLLIFLWKDCHQNKFVTNLDFVPRKVKQFLFMISPFWCVFIFHFMHILIIIDMKLFKTAFLYMKPPDGVENKQIVYYIQKVFDKITCQSNSVP